MNDRTLQDKIIQLTKNRNKKNLPWKGNIIGQKYKWKKIYISNHHGDADQNSNATSSHTIETGIYHKQE